MHVFGFMLPESAEPPMQDKTAALLRLGWLRGDSGTLKDALARLRKVQFHEIPPLPQSGVPFRPGDDESAARVPSPTRGQGAAYETPREPAAPTDPCATAKT